MTDRFTHICTEKQCPSFKQRSCYGSCKCHQTREQMMLAHIERLERLETEGPIVNLEEALGQPAAWIIPGDENVKCDGWIDARADEWSEFTEPLYDLAQIKRAIEKFTP